jgi:hypothetical protein
MLAFLFCGHSERQTMPTDLDPVSARKRAAQSQAQPEITMLLFWLIIGLGMLGLLFEIVRQ